MGKEDIRLFLFTDDCLHRKSERINNNKTHLGQISNYSKVARYKVNIQKLIANKENLKLHNTIHVHFHPQNEMLRV